MTTWIAVLGAATATYLLRISMVVVLAGRPLPAACEHHLRLAGPAVLAAVVASALFVSDGAAQPAPVGHLVALVAAGAVVRRTGRSLHALLVGLPVAALASLLGLGG